MKLATAKRIEEAFDEIGGDECRLHEEYSGRGMMGRATCAISCDSQAKLMKAIALAAARVREDELDQNDTDAKDEKTEEERTPILSLEDFIEDLPKKTDSLGYGIIAY